MQVLCYDPLAHAVFDVEDIVGDLEGNAYEIHALSNEADSFFI